VGNVAKYNIVKGVSTVTTFGTPVVALACSSVDIVTPAGKMSVTACIVCLIAALFLKDKLAENFKMPSAFIVSTILFCLIIMIEHILVPLKSILLASMIASGVDELTFKRWYKHLRLMMSDKANAYEHVGFIFTTSKNLEVSE
jgi:hypothetical protein